MGGRYIKPYRNRRNYRRDEEKYIEIGIWVVGVADEGMNKWVP
jgi:hypothetical protein